MSSSTAGKSILRHASRMSTSSLRASVSKTGVPSISSSRSLATAVDPKTHMPGAEFSSPRVRELLQKSILKGLPDQEVKTRIELAAAYRLFELKGWNENIYNHLTAKVEEEDGTESFLINPFGLRYGEITASSLIKVGANGKIKDHGVTGDTFGINDAGFVIHSAIHRARPEVASVMHCHYPPATGLACTKYGHDYQGIVTDRGEQKSLVDDLGSSNIMILRNHGVITAAESISAAWYLMYELLAASEESKVKKTWSVTRDNGFSGSQFGSKEMSAYMRLLDQKDPSYRL